MSNRYTEDELVIRCQYYSLELDAILARSLEEFIEIINHIPAGIHTNNSTTLELKKVNDFGVASAGYEREELARMGTEFFEKNMHPHFRDIEAPKILHHMWQHPEEVVCFIQYLKYKNDNDFRPTLTFSKICSSDRSQLFCIDLVPSLFHKVPDQIEKIIEVDEFKMEKLPAFQQLTRREKQILSLLGKGFNNPEIADLLYISRHTVETHRKNINRKLEIRHYRDLLKFAIAFDLVQL